MAVRYNCGRCGKVVPFLDEAEWSQVEPLLQKSVRGVKQFRERTGATIEEALGENRATAALAKYSHLTGYFETNADAIWHHRLSDYGGPCAHCGELLRTPRAKYCVECGRTVA
jgi:hypothetical protein